MKETIENFFHIIWDTIFTILEFLNSKLVPYFEIIVLILFMYGCSILLKIEKYLRQDLYNIKENLVEIKKCLDDIVYKLNNK